MRTLLWLLVGIATLALAEHYLWRPLANRLFNRKKSS